MLRSFLRSSSCPSSSFNLSSHVIVAATAAMAAAATTLPTIRHASASSRFGRRKTLSDAVVSPISNSSLSNHNKNQKISKKQQQQLAAAEQEQQQEEEDDQQQQSVALRSWDTNENYCHLCNEPFQAWNEHRGKREHITLELLFECIVEYAREWKPQHVLHHYGKMQSSSSSSSSSPSTSAAHLVPFQSMLNLIDSRERIERRTEIYALARHLCERGVIYFGNRQWKHELFNEMQMTHEGMLVLYYWQHPEILRNMPSAEAAQVSSFSQQCSGLYNLGTVMDLTGLNDLIDPRELPNYVSATDAIEKEQQQQQQSGGGGGSGKKVRLQSINTAAKKPRSSSSSEILGVEDVFASSSSPSPQNQQSGGLELEQMFGDISEFVRADVEGSELVWYTKGIILRNVLGQLRWAISDETNVHDHPIAREVLLHEPHVKVLAERLAVMLVTEMTFARFSEYVTRADFAWRRLGCPTSPLAKSPLAATTPSQHQSHSNSLDPSSSSSSGRSVASRGGTTMTAAASRDQQSSSGGTRTPTFKVPAARRGAVESSPLLSQMHFDVDRSSYFDHHCALRGAGGAKAAEKALLMLHGSYHDGLSALLGVKRGACDFEAGGKATADNSANRFLAPAQGRQWALGELTRLEIDESIYAAKVERARQRALERNPDLFSGAAPQKIRLPRQAGQSLSLTAERMLREAASGVRS